MVIARPPCRWIVVRWMFFVLTLNLGFGGDGGGGVPSGIFPIIRAVVGSATGAIGGTLESVAVADTEATAGSLESVPSITWERPDAVKAMTATNCFHRI